MSGNNSTPNTPITNQGRWTPLKAIKKAVSFTPDPTSSAANTGDPSTPTHSAKKGNTNTTPTISSPFGLVMNPQLAGEGPGSPLLATRPLEIETPGPTGRMPSNHASKSSDNIAGTDGSPLYNTPSSRGAGVTPNKRKGFHGIENSPLSANFPTLSPALPAYSLEQDTGSRLVTIHELDADPFGAVGAKKLPTVMDKNYAPPVPPRNYKPVEMTAGLEKQLTKQEAERKKADELAGGQAYFAAIDAKGAGDYRYAEILMKSLCEGAGGEMITDFVLPDGVAFRLPTISHLPCPPFLPTPLGGMISITPWTPFAPRAPNPLGSHPPALTTMPSPPSAPKTKVDRASKMAANEQDEKVKEWVEGLDAEEGEALATNLGKMKIRKMGAGL